jgi:hypothetical protein
MQGRNTLLLLIEHDTLSSMRLHGMMDSIQLPRDPSRSIQIFGSRSARGVALGHRGELCRSV